MAGAGKLEIDVMVRLDKLESQLKKVEDSVNKTGRKVEATAGKFDKMSAAMGKVAAIGGKIAIAAAAIDAGIKGATGQVHLFRGAWALLKGDTDGALESLEAYGGVIRSLPVVGGILGGLADGIYNLADAIMGWSKELEEAEKELQKIAALTRVTSMTIEYMHQNEQIKMQIALLKETNETKKADISLSMQMADLEARRRKMMAQVTNEHSKGTREHRNALNKINEQIDLQKQVLQLQHEQAEAQRKAAEEEKKAAEAAREAQNLKAGNAEIQASKNVVASLEDQLKIQLAQTDAEKRKLELIAQQKAIMADFAKRQQQIVDNDTLNSKQRQEMHRLLVAEKDLKMDLLRLADQAVKQAEREAEAQRKKEQILRDQRSTIKEQKQLMEDQQRLDSQRSSALSSRLGLASKDGAPAKSGFTETASTAMGSFTFGEQGAQDKIRALQKEQLDLQKQMAQRMQTIEGFTRQLASNMGFS